MRRTSMVTAITRRKHQENVNVTTSWFSSTSILENWLPLWRADTPTVATHNLQFQFGIDRESYRETYAYYCGDP